MAEPQKTYSFKLPTTETVEVIWVRLADGKLVPRRVDELIARPSPPAPAPAKG